MTAHPICVPLKYITRSWAKDATGDAGKGLENAAGYIRTQLAKNLNLRITPELRFIPDASMKRGAHVSELIKKVEKELDGIDAAGDDSREDGE